MGGARLHTSPVAAVQLRSCRPGGTAKAADGRREWRIGLAQVFWGAGFRRMEGFGR